MNLKISRRKHIIIVIIIGVIYFFGVAAIIYPIFGNMVSMNSSQTVIRSYDAMVGDMTDDEIVRKLENARKYNEDIAKGIYNDGLERSLCDASGLMCYVDIPSIDIYIPVYFGTSNEVLQKGCGWLENTSLPVGGNSTHSSISGHTGLPTADMFTDLEKAKVGDMFYIHVIGEVLAYRVDRIETVMPNNTKLLKIIEGEDHCTLLTCTPYGINDKRLLVRGVRVPVVDIPERTDVSSEPQYSGSASDTVSDNTPGTDTEASRNTSNVDIGLQKQINRSMTIMIVIVASAVLLFAGACVWLGVTLKKAARREAAAPEQSGIKRTRIIFPSEDDNGEEKK